MGQSRIFRPTDVADYLGVSTQRVAQMRQEGLLPEPELIDGAGAQWKPGTIERWAEEWWDTRRWRKGTE
jgi:hypothetical protein